MTQNAERRLRVIGAGLPRTATTSLQKALEMVGLGPCHHCQTCRHDSARSLEFARAYDHPDTVDYVQLLKDYPAAVDEPTASLAPEVYTQLKTAGYEVKLVYSQRQSAADWWESMITTIIPANTSLWDWLCALPERNLRCHYTMTSAMMRHWLRKLPKYAPDEVTSVETATLGPWIYHAHERYIRQHIPDQDILFFRAKDGWDPLCAFLGVPVPAAKYPHANDGNTFNARVKDARNKVGAWTRTSTYMSTQY